MIFDNFWRRYCCCCCCCRSKANCPLVGPGPTGKYPLLGLFLINPSPYLREFWWHHPSTNFECRTAPPLVGPEKGIDFLLGHHIDSLLIITKRKKTEIRFLDLGRIALIYQECFRNFIIFSVFICFLHLHKYFDSDSLVNIHKSILQQKCPLAECYIIWRLP